MPDGAPPGQATTRTSSLAERRLEEAALEGSPEFGSRQGQGKGAAIEAPEESEAATAEAPAAEIVPTLMNHAKFSRSRPRPDASASGALLADAPRDCDPDEFFPTPAQLSQMKIAPEDFVTAPEHLPEGKLDVNGQQIDLRSSNSWLLKLQEVSLPSSAEVMAINAIAPFVLNARLQPLGANRRDARCRHVHRQRECDGG